MFCPQCGQEVQPGSHNCSHCGAPMQQDAPVAPAPPAAPPQQPMGGMAPPAPGAPAAGMPGAGMPGGGMPGGGMPGGYNAPPPNNLVWAILVTIFCCLPAGVISIIYAAKVNGLAQAGDMAGALEASKTAKLWAMIGTGIGLVILLINIAFFILSIIAGASGAAAGY